MVVRLRLARHGTRNNPFYHVVAIRDKAARDARPIEKLGEYDPIPRPRVEQQAASVASGSVMSPYDTKQQVIGPVLTSGLEKVEEGKKLEKRIEWNVQRIHYWLGVGAQPSKPVARLLDRAGLIPEGKFYKGMYRPEGYNIAAAAAAAAAAQPKSRPNRPAYKSEPAQGKEQSAQGEEEPSQTSVVLEAAGVKIGANEGKSQSERKRRESSAAVPLRQGELAGNGAKRTNPAAEAAKQGEGQATIDQAA